jgi:hypothetical protein
MAIFIGWKICSGLSFAGLGPSCNNALTLIVEDN